MNLSSSKNLCLEDPITFQGKYHNLFKKGEAYNSGLIGLPPQYDFEKEVFNFWNKNKMDALLLLYPTNKVKNKVCGDFCLDKSGKLLKEKDNEPQYIFTGIQILKSNLFRNVKKNSFPLSLIYKKLIFKKGEKN